ncbi:unnamed protein product [Phytophthora fragariaefolia]|uniref:Unnamed protein product n=1 Tax=Phytophthora fragariaefolia TaxID=1490495 RepID=A0A9W6YBV1_9STRA|nr:unnamed protein product [Phytophthora fragariaefolia]
MTATRTSSRTKSGRRRLVGTRQSPRRPSDSGSNGEDEAVKSVGGPAQVEAYPVDGDPTRRSIQSLTEEDVVVEDDDKEAAGTLRTREMTETEDEEDGVEDAESVTSRERLVIPVASAHIDEVERVERVERVVERVGRVERSDKVERYGAVEGSIGESGPGLGKSVGPVEARIDTMAVALQRLTAMVAGMQTNALSEGLPAALVGRRRQTTATVQAAPTTTPVSHDDEEQEESRGTPSRRSEDRSRRSSTRDGRRGRRCSRRSPLPSDDSSSSSESVRNSDEGPSESSEEDSSDGSDESDGGDRERQLRRHRPSRRGSQPRHRRVKDLELPMFTPSPDMSVFTWIYRVDLALKGAEVLGRCKWSGRALYFILGNKLLENAATWWVDMNRRMPESEKTWKNLKKALLRRYGEKLDKSTAKWRVSMRRMMPGETYADFAAGLRSCVGRNRVSERVLLAQFYRCLEKTTRKLVKQRPKPKTLEEAVDKATDIDDPMENVAQGMINIGQSWATAPSHHVVAMEGTMRPTAIIPGLSSAV